MPADTVSQSALALIVQPPPPLLVETARGHHSLLSRVSRARGLLSRQGISRHFERKCLGSLTLCGTPVPLGEDLSRLPVGVNSFVRMSPPTRTGRRFTVYPRVR